MRLDQLSFSHLSYFRCVAELRHLIQTTQELYTSQFTVSTQIWQLEERLGEELFLREDRHLLLADTGQLALAYAENASGLSQGMLGRLQGSASGVTRLCVGSVVTLSRSYQEDWIRPLLADPSVVLTLESGLLEGLISRLVQHQLGVVLANKSVPSDFECPLRCQFLDNQSIPLVGPVSVWRSRSLRIPEDLEGMEVVLLGFHHVLRTQSETLCVSAGAAPRLRAEVDDMTMSYLIVRGSGWLTVLSEVVVQDGLRTDILIKVGYPIGLQEHFHATTTRHRHRIEVPETLLEHSSGCMGPS